MNTFQVARGNPTAATAEPALRVTRGNPTAATAEPALRVTRGNPTAEELAALVAVLVRPRPAPPATAPRRAGGWNDRAAAIGVRPAPGPGAWRAAAR